MTNIKEDIFNTQKSEKFVSKLIDIINFGSLNIMISIGYRTGLLDVLANIEPSGSEQISEKAGLNKRYVREWLGAMVTGGIVDYDPVNKLYSLPPEHAAWLTRAATPDNVAVTTQWLSVLASVEDKIRDCFKKGGGLSYSDYGRFHEVMADESRQTVIVPLVEHLLPLAGNIIDQLNEGIEVLDLGCGSGLALVEMAKSFPKSSFTGYDLSEDAVATGIKQAADLGLENIKFEAKDISVMNEKEHFDFITTFDVIHDQAKPDVVLKNIYNALKPEGTYFMQDIAGSSFVEKNMEHPIGSFLYTISCLHCMSVSLGQDGKGLGAMWGKELATEMLKDAGFRNIEIKELPHDPINYYYIVKK